MMMDHICCIIPPHILKHIAKHHKDELHRDIALETLAFSEQFRGGRNAVERHPSMMRLAVGVKNRLMYDAQNTQTLPGKFVHGEDGSETTDAETNEAFAGAGVTYDFYKKIYNRNSVDDNGMTLISTVHVGRKFNNAFWNGGQMAYGDGDGVHFNRFTICIDVIGHELTHGVTQYEAGLVYQDQPGALNESMSDVFGSMIKQYSKQQTAEEADWLMGEGLFTKNVKGKALRSLKDPGTAYDDPNFGKDIQPKNMKDYYEGSDDNGGVHINSSIPNHAFYKTAVDIGGYSWEKAGKIWYTALIHQMRPKSNFQDVANITLEIAANLYGSGGKEEDAVRNGWNAVGITATKK